MALKNVYRKSVLAKLVAQEFSCVSLVNCQRKVIVHPFYLNDVGSGVAFELFRTIKTFDIRLNGFILGYTNVKVDVSKSGRIGFSGGVEQCVDLDSYVFQPSVGCCLKGVVNKKSDSHIGILVHEFFNATILKPLDVPDEDWNCHDLEVGDELVFRVQDMDFTTDVPFIEGVVDDDMLAGTQKKTARPSAVGLHETNLEPGDLLWDKGDRETKHTKSKLSSEGDHDINRKKSSKLRTEDHETKHKKFNLSSGEHVTKDKESPKFNAGDHGTKQKNPNTEDHEGKTLEPGKSDDDLDFSFLSPVEPYQSRKKSKKRIQGTVITSTQVQRDSIPPPFSSTKFANKMEESRSSEEDMFSPYEKRAEKTIKNGTWKKNRGSSQSSVDESPQENRQGSKKKEMGRAQSNKNDISVSPKQERLTEENFKIGKRKKDRGSSQSSVDDSPGNKTSKESPKTKKETGRGKSKEDDTSLIPNRWSLPEEIFNTSKKGRKKESSQSSVDETIVNSNQQPNETATSVKKVSKKKEGRRTQSSPSVSPTNVLLKENSPSKQDIKKKDSKPAFSNPFFEIPHHAKVPVKEKNEVSKTKKTKKHSWDSTSEASTESLGLEDVKKKASNGFIVPSVPAKKSAGRGSRSPSKKQVKALENVALSPRKPQVGGDGSSTVLNSKPATPLIPAASSPRTSSPRKPPKRSLKQEFDEEHLIQLSQTSLIDQLLMAAKSNILDVDMDAIDYTSSEKQQKTPKKRRKTLNDDRTSAKKMQKRSDYSHTPEKKPRERADNKSTSSRKKEKSSDSKAISEKKHGSDAATSTKKKPVAETPTTDCKTNRTPPVDDSENMFEELKLLFENSSIAVDARIEMMRSRLASGLSPSIFQPNLKTATETPLTSKKKGRDKRSSKGEKGEGRH